MLEVKGELVFKTVAYHRAADAIGRSPVDLVAAYRAGDRADRSRASARRSATRSRSSPRPAAWPTTTGSAPRSRPASSSCCEIPGLGPKTVRQLYERARHRDHRRPAPGRRGGPPARPQRASRPRPRRSSSRASPGSTTGRPDAARPGRGARSTALIDGAVGDARASPRSSRPARSVAGKETIGDLDLLAETDDRRRSSSVHDASALVDPVVNRGGYKAAVRLLRGPQVDLMVMPPGEAGTYRIHFTGSKEHNVRLAGDGARPGLEPVREGLPADRRGRRAADRRRRRAADVRAPRRRPTPSSACRTSSPSCARTPARSRRPWPAACRDLIDARRPARRPAQPLGLVRRRPPDRGHGRGRPRARPRLPGPDRPHPVAGHRPRPDARTGSSSSARSSPRSTPGTRPRRRPARRRPRRRPRASACSTAASSRSAPTARSTTTTTCWRASTSSSPRSTSRAARSRAELTRRTLNAHPQPARRRHRPPVRPHDRPARRPRPRLGRGLRGGGPDRHRARDERLAASPGPRRRARPPRGRGWAACCRSTRTPTTSRELDYVRWGISQARRAWVEPERRRSTPRSRADLLALGRRQAGPAS